MRPKFTKTSLGLAIVACLQVLSPMSTYAQTITYGSYRTSVNGSITSGNRLFESADIYVDSAGGLSGGTQIFAGFDAFPSFPTPEGSNLRVSAANGVTGGQQIFHHYSQAFVSATHGMSGANITLHDDSLVDAMADDAFGTGASILFAGNSGLFLYGEQFLKLNGHNTTIGAINSTAGKGRISNVGGGTAQFTVSSGAYSGVITDGGGGALGLTKAGAGTLTLSGSSNTYSGGTTITAGTLIATNGGALGSGNLSIGSAGTLQATGTITGAIGVTGTLSNSPGAIGSLTTGAQTWNGGGSYAMDFSNAAGAAGTGYDLLAINGQLGIASNSGTPFTIAMNSKSWVPGFDSTANGTWTLAQTTGITGYDAGDFAVSTANFANGFNGTFSVVTSGNNLVLNYTGAPNIVTGGWNTSTNGSITSSVRQMGGLTVNTANGVSGGDIYAGAFEITASDGITGGYQQFNSGGSDSFLYAARSITGGTQVFNGSNDYVYISANDAITGGVQTFNVNSVDMTSGSISGGEQRFYGGTALSSNGGGTITGGTQKFYNLLSIFESGLSVTGGEQNFYNGAELLATAGGITGGVQNFYDLTTLIARDDANAITGGSQNFYGNSRLQAGKAGTITNSTLIFSGNSRMQAFASGLITNSSIELRESAIISAFASNPLGVGTTLSFNGGGSVQLYGGEFTAYDLQSLTQGAGLIQIVNPTSSTTFIANVGGTSSKTFSGSLSASHPSQSDSILSFKKVGTGTQVLSGSNSYTGTTTIEGGTLRFAKVASFYNGVVDVTNAAKLTVAANATAAFNVGGAGEFTMTAINTLNSANFAAGSILGLDTTNAVGGTITATGDRAGSVGLTKLGTGSLILTGANTYTGGTLVSGGTLQIGNGGTTGSVAGDITNNAAVVFNRSDSFTHAGAISGSGSLTHSGGTLNLSGANTYTGNTTISAGTLALGAANRLSDVTNVSVASGTTFNLAGFNETVGSVAGAGDILLGSGALAAGNSGASTTFSGVISGNGGTFTKTGSGTLTLSGSNTYTGDTTVSAGSLVVNGNISTSILTTVGLPATLSGTGYLGKTIINGTLAPGLSPGQLNFTDTLSLNGIITMEIDGNAGAGLTGGHDFVNLTGVGAAGVLTYGGTMTIDISVILAPGIYSWNLFDMASETGTFTSITFADQYSGALLDGDLNGIWDQTSGSNTWLFTESTGMLGLTVIPEPNVAALIGAFGMFTMLRRRRNGSVS